jgi:glycosyltransferase involved in cell wall biosynthesis
VRVETIVVTSPRTRPATVRHLAELERRHEGLRLRPEEGLGFAAALNTGIRAAAASRVGLLLSDDWLDPRAVEACLASDADIVSTGLRGYAADGVRVLNNICRVPTMEEFYRQPTRERQASYLKHFLLFRRRAVLDAGGVVYATTSRIAEGIGPTVKVGVRPEKIQIVPKKDDQSVAEITVAYHERRPVAPGSPLESILVDIGVFANNGASQRGYIDVGHLAPAVAGASLFFVGLALTRSSMRCNS